MSSSLWIATGSVESEGSGVKGEEEREPGVLSEEEDVDMRNDGRVEQ